VAVNAGIPMVMAYMGDHLAAESEESDAKKLFWRVLFFSLAVVGIVGTFFLELQLEREHKVEMSEFQSNVSSDVTKNVALTWAQYNREHPQHPLTLEQFSDWWNSYESRMSHNSSQSKQATQSGTSIAPPRVQTPAQAVPVILSAPPGLADGTITGRNFGTRANAKEVVVRFRLTPAAQSGPYSKYATFLLGGLNSTNEIHLPVQKWSDTAIEVKSEGFLKQYLPRIASTARDRGFPPPNQSDIEVQYQIVQVDGPDSNLFPP
jgi:hypothetical protein